MKTKYKEKKWGTNTPGRASPGSDRDPERPGANPRLLRSEVNKTVELKERFQWGGFGDTGDEKVW